MMLLLAELSTLIACLKTAFGAIGSAISISLEAEKLWLSPPERLSLSDASDTVSEGSMRLLSRILR
jgi:hypothetical protein